MTNKELIEELRKRFKERRRILEKGIETYKKNHKTNHYPYEYRARIDGWYFAEHILDEVLNESRNISVRYMSK